MAAIFLFVFVLVLGAALTAWALISRYARTSAAAKIRARLMPDRIERRSTAGKVALFEKEQRPTGSPISRIMDWLALRERLRLLTEQAGAKTDPVRQVQKSLAFFIAGYMAMWTVLPPRLSFLGLAAAAASSAVPFLSLVRKR